MTPAEAYAYVIKVNRGRGMWPDMREALDVLEKHEPVFLKENAERDLVMCAHSMNGLFAAIYEDAARMIDELRLEHLPRIDDIAGVLRARARVMRSGAAKRMGV